MCWFNGYKCLEALAASDKLLRRFAVLGGGLRPVTNNERTTAARPTVKFFLSVLRRFDNGERNRLTGQIADLNG
jgi:hypothetical protein